MNTHCFIYNAVDQVEMKEVYMYEYTLFQYIMQWIK